MDFGVCNLGFDGVLEMGDYLTFSLDIETFLTSVFAYIGLMSLILFVLYNTGLISWVDFIEDKNGLTSFDTIDCLDEFTLLILC